MLDVELVLGIMLVLVLLAADDDVDPEDNSLAPDTPLLLALPTVFFM